MPNVITVATVEDALRLALKDKTRSDSTTGFMSSAEYERFILSGDVRPSQTWNCQLVRTGYWVYQGGPLAIFGPASGTDLVTGGLPAGSPGTNYTVTCASGDPLYGTVSVHLTSGTDTQNPLAVTGCYVNYGKVLESLLVFIATHRASEYSQSVNGASVSPETARRELLAQASVVAGVRAI
jgi:hypothetical protein